MLNQPDPQLLQSCILALAGGLLLAIAASLNLWLLGKITGMSGLVNSALMLQKSNWPAVISGLLFTGAIAHLCLGWGYQVSSPFGLRQTVTAGKTFLSFGLSGLLVGLGTRLGNGCTSGHGVCGLPRLSLRSIVAVAIFMGCGLGMATLNAQVGFGPAFDQASGSPDLVDPLVTDCFVAGVSIILFSLHTLRAYWEGSAKSSFIGFLVGAIFAVGLLLSGMTRRAKIIGFLAITADWNPALICVMGGAVMFNFLAFRCILSQDKPILAQQFTLPKKTEIDKQLVVGAALFGLGWGLGGFCPGPALVLLGIADFKLYTWFVCLCVGMLAGNKIQQWVVSQQKESN